MTYAPEQVAEAPDAAQLPDEPIGHFMVHLGQSYDVVKREDYLALRTFAVKQQEARKRAERERDEYKDRLSCELCDKDLTITDPDGGYCVPVCVECHNNTSARMLQAEAQLARAMEALKEAEPQMQISDIRWVRKHAALLREGKDAALSGGPEGGEET